MNVIFATAFITFIVSALFLYMHLEDAALWELIQESYSASHMMLWTFKRFGARVFWILVQDLGL